MNVEITIKIIISILYVTLRVVKCKNEFSYLYPSIDYVETYNRMSVSSVVYLNKYSSNIDHEFFVKSTTMSSWRQTLVLNPQMMISKNSSDRIVDIMQRNRFPSAIIFRDFEPQGLLQKAFEEPFLTSFFVL